MTVTVTHATVATFPDEPGAEVNKDQWNEAHSISGLGSAAEHDAADFATAAQGALADSALQPGDPSIPTTESVQDLVGAMATDSSTIDFTYDDGAGTLTAIVKDGSVTFAKMQNIATSRLLGRTSASSGSPEELTVTAPLALSSGALGTSMATGKLIGRSTSGTGAMEEITLGSGLALVSGVLSGSVVSPTVSLKSADYTFQASDANKVIGHASTDNNARLFTVPASTFSDGDSLEIPNLANNLTIALATPGKIYLEGTTGLASAMVISNPERARLRQLSTNLWIGGARSLTPSYYGSVLLIGNDNAANGTTTPFVDQSIYVATPSRTGNIAYTNAQAPTGMTTVLGGFNGTGNYLTVPASVVFSFGTGDFTVEYLIYYTSNTGTKVHLDGRTGGSDGGFLIYTNGTNLIYQDNNATRVTGTMPATGGWTHMEVSRSGGTLKVFRAGTQTGSDYTGNFNFSATRGWRVGESIGGGNGLVSNDYICCIRVTYGRALHTANFTPPTLPLAA